MPGITIVGSGRYAPGEPVSNFALARVMDTSAEWIRQRTGIEQRHYAGEGTGASDLGVIATRRMLLKQLKALQKGQAPAQPQTPDAYHLRSLALNALRAAVWQDVMREHMQLSLSPSV